MNLEHGQSWKAAWIIDRVWLHICTKTAKKKTQGNPWLVYYIFHGRHWRLWQEPVQVVAHSAPVSSQHLQTTPSVEKILEYFCFWDKSVLASDVICFWDAETVTISNSRSRVEEGLGIPMLDPSVFNETWASVIISSRQKDNTGKWSCKRQKNNIYINKR